MSIDVVVNGDRWQLLEGSTVADVVARLLPGGGTRGTAVAVGDAVVPAGQWGSTTVAAGDRIEVLHAVAGG